MEDNDLFSKSNLINIQYDKISNLSGGLNDSISIKEKYIYNDILSFKNKDFFDESFEYNNFQKEFNKINFPEIIKESIKSEKETFSKSKKNIPDALNKEKEELIKRQLHLKRNRENSRDSRKRKKYYIQNLINENNKLKIKYNNLLNIIQNCQMCKEKLKLLEKNEGENKKEFIFEAKNNIINREQKNTNKKKILFIAAISIISIINLFNIPINIIKYNNNFDNNNLDYLRHLNSNNYSNDDLETLFIQKINSSNGNNEGLFIHFAEYYSLIKEAGNILNEKPSLNYGINNNVQVFKNDEIKSEQMSKEYASECTKCIIDVDRQSIKAGGNEFTFYFADRFLFKLLDNTFEEGIFTNYNNDKIKKNQKIVGLKCKIIGYSINDLFLGKI